MKRRTFLKTMAATAFGFQVVPGFVLGGNGQTPPSRKLNLAAIGAGGRAASNLKEMDGENMVALCDVDDRRAGPMFKKFPDAQQFKDFRKLLDAVGDKIDGVVVSTPDHTHAVAATAAMRRGKHVYCEKPLTHSVAEVRALRKAAKARNLITQVGNQGHSSDSIRVFCEWIWDGAIGNVTEVHAGRHTKYDGYFQIKKLDQVRKERPPVPPELDWNLWQGPAPVRPYHPAYVPVTWRGWMTYGTGVLGDWVCHVVDPVFWALDLDMPTSIQAETDGYDPGKHSDLYPDGTKITFEFPAKGKRGPVKLVWYDGQRTIPRPDDLEADRKVVETGAVVIGDRGKITYGSHGAGSCRIIPAIEDAGIPTAGAEDSAFACQSPERLARRDSRRSSGRFVFRVRRTIDGDRFARRDCHPFHRPEAPLQRAHDAVHQLPRSQRAPFRLVSPWLEPLTKFSLNETDKTEIASP
jgi:predicted dehydrogenase